MPAAAIAAVPAPVAPGGTTAMLTAASPRARFTRGSVRAPSGAATARGGADAASGTAGAAAAGPALHTIGARFRLAPASAAGAASVAALAVLLCSIPDFLTWARAVCLTAASAAAAGDLSVALSAAILGADAGCTGGASGILCRVRVSATCSRAVCLAASAASAADCPSVAMSAPSRGADAACTCGSAVTGNWSAAAVAGAVGGNACPDGLAAANDASAGAVLAAAAAAVANADDTVVTAAARAGKMVAVAGLSWLPPVLQGSADVPAAGAVAEQRSLPVLTVAGSAGTICFSTIADVAAGSMPGGPAPLRTAEEAAEGVEELLLDAPEVPLALLLVVVEVLRPELAAFAASSALPWTLGSPGSFRSRPMLTSLG